MNMNVNSVNINDDPRGYHHGDLRAALVSAGLELLKSRAADDLSLREVARAVNVSATSVYRHFPDKQALLHALAEEGGRAMAAAQISARDAAMGPRVSAQAGFDAMGQAYVRFALANPALFRLMMSVHPPEGYFNESGPSVNVAMQLLQESIADQLPANASERQRKIAAIHAWSLVHGMAVLMLDGLIEADEDVIATISGGARAGGSGSS